MDDYETPDWIRDIFDFDNWFDPCPLRKTYGVDGLKIQWGKRAFVNPPYSNPAPWIDKAISELKHGYSRVVVMLLRVDTSTKWFAKLVEADAEILWFSKRLKFTDKPANFPSMLVILK